MLAGDYFDFYATDEDNEQMHNISTHDLNTIRVKLEWGRSRKSQKLKTFTSNLQERGPVHE
jgi:hypothetical protein